MKAEEQTKLNETLSKVFKLDAEQLATLYNEAGDLTDMNVVTEADAKRVSKFNTEKTSQYNRGIKEGAGKIEKELKDKYEVESDQIGVELVESIIAKQLEATGKDKKDITKHPDYIKLESSLDKKLKERDRDWEKKIEDKEREFNSAKLFEKVRDRALVNLDGRKPILPSVPEKAQTWRDTYLNELRSGKYQEGEDGEIIVLDKEGNVLKDKHGNPVTFNEYEKGISDKYFEYQKAEPRNSPGNKTPSQSGGSEPKTKDECIAKLKDPKITPEDRKKFTDLMDNLK